MRLGNGVGLCSPCKVVLDSFQILAFAKHY